jgi:hypothetical protein
MARAATVVPANLIIVAPELSPRRDQILPGPLKGRSLLDLPIMTFKMRDDLLRDLVLFVLGERAAHAANAPKPVTQAHDYGKTKLVGTRPHADTREQKRNIVKGSMLQFANVAGDSVIHQGGI